MASEMMKAAFCHQGCLTSIDCQSCGRVHFCETCGGDFEEGELEGLKQRAFANPHRYIAHTDTIRWGVYNGLQIVADCPCEPLSALESIIWEHRLDIADYLVERTTKEIADIDNEQKQLQAVRRVMRSIASTSW